MTSLQSFFFFLLIPFVFLLTFKPSLVGSIDPHADWIGLEDQPVITDFSANFIDSGRPEYRETLFPSPNDVPSILNTGAVVSDEQDAPLFDLNIAPTVQNTDPIDSEGQEGLFVGLETALAVPNVEIDQSSSGTVPCNSKDNGQQIGDKSNGFCIPLDEKPNQRDRTDDYVEPPQRKYQDPVEYGSSNPWIRGFDNNKKQCSNTKHTLYCDGPAHLTAWVANCATWAADIERQMNPLKVYCCRGFDLYAGTRRLFQLRYPLGLGRGDCRFLFAV